MNKVQETEKKVFSYMERYHMVSPGDAIVLGVSGGADSVCLLLLLYEYSKTASIRPVVAHVNHMIRPEAGEDALFVQQLCASLKIDCYRKQINVEELARQLKCSTEDAGRQARYAFFREIAESTGSTKIAVAHHRGDQAETVLLHLFRGAGVGGLSGIRPVRNEIIRPLLCLDRQQIEEYLMERHQSWMTDATNGQDDYMRNRIRHHVIPYAEKEICGAVSKNICQTAEYLQEAEDYLMIQTQEALESCAEHGNDGSVRFQTASFLPFPIILQKRMLMMTLQGLSPTGKDIFSVHVEEVRRLFEKNGNGQLMLPFGIRAFKCYDYVILNREGCCEEKEKSLPEIVFEEIYDGTAENVPRNQYTKWFDYDKIEECPTIRFRLPGDYITISDGKGGIIKKSLKAYMIDQKIPRMLRDSIPLAASGNHIIWIIGYRISEYFKVSKETGRILQMKMITNDEGRESEEEHG